MKEPLRSKKKRPSCPVCGIDTPIRVDKIRTERDDFYVTDTHEDSYYLCRNCGIRYNSAEYIRKAIKSMD